MLEIEENILAWRAKMKAALPANPRLVDEFEDHLRESIAVLLRDGVSNVDAFSQATNRIGDPRVIAFQYRHIRNQKNTMNVLHKINAWLDLPLRFFLLRAALLFCALAATVCMLHFINLVSNIGHNFTGVSFALLATCVMAYGFCRLTLKLKDRAFGGGSSHI
jgi:hypothetical protein